MSFYSLPHSSHSRGLFLLLVCTVLTSLSVGATTNDNIYSICDEYKPPFGPVNYTDMPYAEGDEGYGSYRNLPFQNIKDNIMLCNIPGPGGESLNIAYNATGFRYYNSHISEMFTTKIAPRGTGPINMIPKVKNLKYHMRKIEKLQIDQSRYEPLGYPTTTLNFTYVYERDVTDALLVIHKGKIYYEKYEEPHYSEMQLHLVYSMTKSYVGIIAAMLAAEGAIDPDKPVSYYLPELADPINANVSYEEDNSHYDKMTVRNLMDMSSSTSYNEVYNSSTIDYFGTAYNDVRNIGGIGYRNLPLLYGKNSKKEQGYEFEYKTMDTMILAMVLESNKVLNGNGKVLEYFYDNIWSKLGQESHISILADWQKHPSYGGGAQVTARDAARFGMMMLNGGKNMNGDQIVPEEVVRDISNGGTQLNKDQMQRHPYNRYLIDAYRNQFWVRKAGKIFSQIGIFGQLCYINIEKDLVIVKFSSGKKDQSASYEDIMDVIASYFEETPKGKKSKKKNNKKKSKKKMI